MHKCLKLNTFTSTVSMKSEGIRSWAVLIWLRLSDDYEISSSLFLSTSEMQHLKTSNFLILNHWNIYNCGLNQDGKFILVSILSFKWGFSFCMPLVALLVTLNFWSWSESVVDFDSRLYILRLTVLMQWL